jgi:hypothetical protein
MPITAQQTAAIKKILSDYRRGLKKIVHEHKEEVKKAVTKIDERKAAKIKALIEKS